MQLLTLMPDCVIDQLLVQAIKCQSTIHLADSPIHQANRSLAIHYNFVDYEGVSAAEVQFTSPFSISFQPYKIALWVYGDASGIWLRSLLVDATGKKIPLNFTEQDPAGVYWTGWRYIEAFVPANQSFQPPFSMPFLIRLLSTVAQTKKAGTLFVDHMRIYEHAFAEDVTPPKLNYLTIQEEASQLIFTISIFEESTLQHDTMAVTLNNEAIAYNWHEAQQLLEIPIRTPLLDGYQLLSLDLTDLCGNRMQTSIPFSLARQLPRIDWAFPETCYIHEWQRLLITINRPQQLHWVSLFIELIGEITSWLVSDHPDVMIAPSTLGQWHIQWRPNTQTHDKVHMVMYIKSERAQQIEVTLHYGLTKVEKQMIPFLLPPLTSTCLYPFSLAITGQTYSTNGTLFVRDLTNKPIANATILLNGHAVGSTDCRGTWQSNKINEQAVMIQAVKDNKTSAPIWHEPLLPANIKPFLFVWKRYKQHMLHVQILWLTSANERHYTAMYNEAFVSTVHRSSPIETALGELCIVTVDITHLQWNSTYSVTLHASNHSYEYHFRTMPRQRCNAIFITDSHITNDTQTVTQLLNDGELHTLLLHGGDIVDDGSMFTQWQQALQPLTTSTFFAPVLGNHDVYGASIFQTLLKSDDTPFGAYILQHAVVTFYFLQTELDERTMQQQAHWLKQQLTEDVTTWRIIIMHRSPFPTNPLGDGNPLVKQWLFPIIDAMHVDVVLTGHDHQYSRTLPINGTVYINGGASGEKFYSTQPQAVHASCLPYQVPIITTLEMDAKTLCIYSSSTCQTIAETFSITK